MYHPLRRVTHKHETPKCGEVENTCVMRKTRMRGRYEYEKTRAVSDGAKMMVSQSGDGERGGGRYPIPP